MSFSANTTLRPGILVGCKTAVKGNATYDRVELEDEKIDAAGTLTAKWQTEKTVLDAAEHELALKVRGRARNIVSRICANTNFGLLCPEDKEDELNEALNSAKALCDEFNRTSNITTISFGYIKGRVAATDIQAVRAINKEVRELIEVMETSLTNQKAEEGRNAAGQLKKLGTALSLEAQAKIGVSVDLFRATMKKIVAAGEQGAAEIDKATLVRLREARTSFLDLDGPVAEINLPTHQGRALDLPESVA